MSGKRENIGASPIAHGFMDTSYATSSLRSSEQQGVKVMYKFDRRSRRSILAVGR